MWSYHWRMALAIEEPGFPVLSKYFHCLQLGDDLVK